MIVPGTGASTGGAENSRHKSSNFGKGFMGARRRIAILSEDLAEPWDEGIKKYAYSIAKALEKKASTLLINVDRSGVEGKAAERVPATKTFLSGVLRAKLQDFSPEFVLYVPSPSSTIASFWRARVLRRFAPKAHIGMVAMIPRRHHAFWRWFLSFTAPDVVFVPSYASLLYLHSLSLRGEILPLGVDLEKFRHPLDGEKPLLRKKYGVDEEAFVFLHAGHLSRKRNLEKLGKLSSTSGCEVVVISSTSTPEDMSLKRELEAMGIKVIREYVDIEEYYRLADCYVFPVQETEGCVEFPLSVLEALSSGLPVLTTPFGGIRDFLPQGPDLVYWEDSSELISNACHLRTAQKPPVRSMEDFSWDRAAAALLVMLER